MSEFYALFFVSPRHPFSPAEFFNAFLFPFSFFEIFSQQIRSAPICIHISPQFYIKSLFWCKNCQKLDTAICISTTPFKLYLYFNKQPFIVNICLGSHKFMKILRFNRNYLIKNSNAIDHCESFLIDIFTKC